MICRRSLIILIALLLPATALAATKYIVKKGDNLYDLSRKFGVSVDELKSANNLKSNKLDIGDVLTIDGSASSDKTGNTVARSNNNEYFVKKGDTLGEIAEKYSVSTDSLQKANSLKNTKLQIGQKLLIPSPDNVSVQVNAAKAPSESVHDNGQAGVIPEQAKKAAEAPAEYTVQKGDTLGHIAVKFNVSSADIKSANGLKNDSLQIGQTLRIPAKDKISAVAQSPSEKVVSRDISPRTENGYYTVEKGDTPSGIAGKLGVKTDELISVNKLNSKTLQIGQKLAVPGYQSKEAASLDTDTGKGDANRDSADVKPETPKAIPSEYTVKNGDTLYDLAKKYGMPVDTIKKSNNLKSNNLRIGQKLVFNGAIASVADKDTGPAAITDAHESTATKTSAAKYAGHYTVRKGDTLGQLALKFGVSQGELKNANGLKNSNLRIGQVLDVPGTAAAPDNEQIVIRETAPEPVSEIYIKKRYVVKAGDTLSGIASSFGVTVGELKKASALKNDVINKGDILLIPIPQEKVTTSNYKYTVVAGDSLGKISKKFNVSVKTLREVNRLAGDNIRIGMKLNIPGLYPPESSDEAAEGIAAVSSPRGEYVVKKGDSLGRIARRFGVTIKELKKENNIKGNTINSGQVLYIPGYGHRETEYMAVTKANAIKDSNGHSIGNNSRLQNSEPQVKNGRFSKESIIEVAKKYLGAPYKFGGYDLVTGIDCSGYVKKIFSRFNVYLPRTARDIYYKSGSSVSKSNLDTGDLVFFHTYAKYPSHVGIYIGNDEFIHASSASRMVTIDNLNKHYYRARYIGAKRIQLSGLFYDELSKDYAGFEN